MVEEKYMKREIDEYLNEYDFEKPLVVLGARQIGKTTTIRHFAEKYGDFIYINFLHDKVVCKLFEEINLEPELIVSQLEMYLKVEMTENTLMIFDEIQESGDAYNSLKAFNESGRNYKIIATGSLLGVMLTNTKTVPVGQVELKQMYPMNFCEFLEIIDEKNLLNQMREVILGKPLVKIFHEKLNQLHDIFLMVSGYPEAVKIFKKTGSIKNAQAKIDLINQFYINDFNKYLSPINASITRAVYNSIEIQLGKDNQKFMKKHIPGLKASQDYNFAIEWLLSAGIVVKVNNLNAITYPLKFVESSNSFRLFLADTGIVIQRVDFEYLDLKPENKIFTGIIAENYCAQEFNKQKLNINYYDNHSMEIDFIIQYGQNIIPIEVKAAYNTKAKSLRNYIQKFEPKLAIRISKNQFGYTHNNVLNVPIYMVSIIEELLQHVLKK